MYLNSLNLFYGILFCLSITALVIACLAFTKKVYVGPKLPSKSQIITPADWQNPKTYGLGPQPHATQPSYMCKGQGVVGTVGSGNMATKGGGSCPCSIGYIPRWWSAASGWTGDERNTLNACASTMVSGGITSPADCKNCADAWALLNREKPWNPDPKNPRYQAFIDAGCGGDSGCDPESNYPHTDGTEFVSTCSWCQQPGAWTEPEPCNPAGDCGNCKDCCTAQYGCTDFSKISSNLPANAVKSFCNLLVENPDGKYCGS